MAKSKIPHSQNNSNLNPNPNPKPKPKPKPKPNNTAKSKAPRQGFDPLYKELITTYLNQLVETIAPELASCLDFSKAVAQSQELYVYRNKALHGHKKQVDHLFEVPFLSIEESAKILIHVELENNDDLETMQKRMLHYFHLIDLKFENLDVLPIVLFFNQKAMPGIHMKTIKKGKYFETFQFNFMQWGLGNDDAEKWLKHKQPKPLYAALATHMKSQTLTAEEIGLNALSLVKNTEKNDNQVTLLLDYIESFLDLKPDQKERFLQQVKSTQGVDQMYQRWSERIANEAINLGEVRGIEKGKIEGKIETLMTILETFNIQCSNQEEALLKSISDARKLDEILIALTKSQGQTFHDIMKEISQIS
jgi:hypothetical protein